MARLIISSPDGKRGVFEIGKPVITIGRGSANDLVLNDPSVSRFHAVLKKSAQDDVSIADRGSTNGVLLDGARITGETPIATGTKVKIDNYGKDRDGVSVATLDEVAFAYMKKYGATRVSEVPGKPSGYEETGSVSSAIPGVGFSAATSTAANHTYEMEADALAEIGHHGFTVDAQAMTALLYDFLTKPDYRAQVKREFDGIRTLFDEYRSALRKVYDKPNVADPK